VWEILMYSAGVQGLLRIRGSHVPLMPHRTVGMRGALCGGAREATGGEGRCPLQLACTRGRRRGKMNRYKRREGRLL